MRQRSVNAVLDQVRKAIEEGAADRTDEVIRGASRALGGDDVAREFAAVVAGRVVGKLEHGSASERLIDLASRLPHTLSAEGWSAFEKISQAIGCFVASGHFLRGSLAMMATRGSVGQQFVAAVVQRDLDTAAKLGRESVKALGSDALHYLWWWSAGTSGAPQWSTEQAWVSSLHGSQVLVLGPAPTTLSRSDLGDETLVARVIAPGVTSWPANDVAGGRCDLAYANSKSTKWFLAQADRDVFGTFQWVSFRTDKGMGLGLANGRVSVNHKALLPMPWDKTNMVPLAVWDLSHVPDVDMVVAGTTFFASRTAYTPHDLRVKEERGGATDQRGSTGLAFERCLSFSHHALIAHRSFVANWVSAGAIGIDQEGRAVLALSDDEYLAELDELYGVDAV